jgi:hypothetical protein
MRRFKVIPHFMDAAPTAPHRQTSHPGDNLTLDRCVEANFNRVNEQERNIALNQALNSQGSYT